MSILITRAIQDHTRRVALVIGSIGRAWVGRGEEGGERGLAQFARLSVELDKRERGGEGAGSRSPETGQRLQAGWGL